MTEMTPEQLEEIIGSSAMRDYGDTKEWARPKLHAWAAKLRYMAAGHAEDCHGDDIYKTAWNRAYKEAGHGTIKPKSCTCGKEG